MLGAREQLRVPIIDPALVEKDKKKQYENSGTLVFQAARLLVEHITEQPSDIPYEYVAGDKPPYDIVVSKVGVRNVYHDVCERNFVQSDCEISI